MIGLFIKIFLGDCGLLSLGRLDLNLRGGDGRLGDGHNGL